MIIMAFPLSPIGKSILFATISVVFFSAVESRNPTLADLSYVRAQNPLAYDLLHIKLD